MAFGILSAAGLTAFPTGVTEPLEFAFMFVAFPLYIVHALLTGLSLAIAYLLDIHLGFSFSAGLIDLLLWGNAPPRRTSRCSWPWARSSSRSTTCCSGS